MCVTSSSRSAIWSGRSTGCFKASPSPRRAIWCGCARRCGRCRRSPRRSAVGCRPVRAENKEQRTKNKELRTENQEPPDFGNWESDEQAEQGSGGVGAPEDWEWEPELKTQNSKLKTQNSDR